MPIVVQISLVALFVTAMSLFIYFNIRYGLVKDKNVTDVVEQYFYIEQWVTDGKDWYWSRALYLGKPSRFDTPEEAWLRIDTSAEYPKDREYRVVKVTVELIYGSSQTTGCSGRSGTRYSALGGSVGA